MTAISFFVPGLPRPAGSKRAFCLRKGGVLTGRAIVTDDNPKSADWKSDVRNAAQAHYKGALIEIPVKMTLEFVMPRPKAHYRTGKMSAQMRPDAPYFHYSKPDSTKLTRGVEDALTNVIWKDDSLVVLQVVSKIYGARPGVTIIIEEALPEMQMGVMFEASTQKI